MTNNLTKNIQYFKGVGSQRASLFKKLGIHNANDLIHYYPRRYEDWSDIKKITEAHLNPPCCIRVTITEPPLEKRLKGGRSVFNAFGTDGESIIKIIIWGNKYSAGKLKEGGTYLLYGTVSSDFFGYTISSPDIASKQSSARIRPVYRTTSALSSKSIESVMDQALDLLKQDDGFSDYLPPEIRQKYDLLDLKTAILRIHFPKNIEDVNDARRRLGFDELLILMLGLYMLKNRKNRNENTVKIKDFSDGYITALPFAPTAAQKRAISDAAKDMQSGKPMNRLLQGDVGSGKTAVAAALCYNAAKSGYQSAFMAPTELLAVQHFYTLSSLLAPFGVKIELLTGRTPASEKRNIKMLLKSGDIDIVIGTHAIFQKDVEFSSLGLVITDEQHRFGVEQRNTLTKKGDNPHLYVMSATPIPRTLALIIYGDLNISLLDEMPPGRKKINTYAVNSSYRKRIYSYIKRHIEEGRQAYIVCPMIEENETDLTAAAEYFERLKNSEFKHFSVALLHGGMKPAEKDEVMRDFQKGAISLLISTTVIEVGIDVPNATIMVIENAERFGLSQLHQLRGRIGRGEHESDCILISDSKKESALQRLEILKQSTDGFFIADEDLKMRGAGDFFGNRQSGLPEFKIADLLKDTGLVFHAKAAALEIIEKDKELKDNQRLLDLVNKLFADNDMIRLN